MRKANPFVLISVLTVTLLRAHAQTPPCGKAIVRTEGPKVDERFVAAPPRAVTLPKGTPLKVLLREPLYSKKFDKNTTAQTIPFEVAEDVIVDGAALMRRGALVTAHLTEVERAKGRGRHAQIQFAFDEVTAVDGQKISITGGDEKTRGGRHGESAPSGLLQGGGLAVAVWMFNKGSEVFIRAGTGYDVQISGQHTIQTGQ